MSAQEGREKELAGYGNLIAHKNNGEFELALDMYSQRFGEALGNGNEFVAEKCFEQVFDILLLTYRIAGPLFHSESDLQRSLSQDVTDRLANWDTNEAKLVDSFFEDCWRRMKPRGRGQNPFSVNRDALVNLRVKTWQ